MVCLVVIRESDDLMLGSITTEGSNKYYSMSHYSTILCEPADDEYQASVSQGYDGDMQVKQTVDPTWRRAASYYLYYVPWGLRGSLNWIRTHYNNVPVIIGEKGATDQNGTISNSFRIDFHREYIQAMTRAIQEDGCDVHGDTVWSLMDNFEWGHGNTEKFGLYDINFSDPLRNCVPKDDDPCVTFPWKQLRDPVDTASFAVFFDRGGETT